MHQRQVIRTAVVDALIGSTAAGASVFPTRIFPFVLPELPVIAVYTLTDDVDDDSITTSPRELTRQLSVIIEALSAPGPNIDNTMDDLAAQIETAMHADPYFGGACSNSILSSTSIESIEEGDREVGWMSLDYTFKYYTEAPEASVLDDFNTAQTVYNLGSEVHPDEDAEDQIEVQP